MGDRKLSITIYQELSESNYKKAHWVRDMFIEIQKDLNEKDRNDFIESFNHYAIKAGYYSRTARELAGIEE